MASELIPEGQSEHDVSIYTMMQVHVHTVILVSSRLMQSKKFDHLRRDLQLPLK